ncbi:hypothetical protein Tco_0847344 [Tanacetum coccineum]
MDDEPMWAADHVVAPTPGSAITIPETANEFAIKGNHLTLVKGNQFDGRTKTDPHNTIHEFLRICDICGGEDGGGWFVGMGGWLVTLAWRWANGELCRLLAGVGVAGKSCRKAGGAGNLRERGDGDIV